MEEKHGSARADSGDRGTGEVGAGGGGEVPKMRRYERKVTSARTKGERQRETEDPLTGLQDREAGGGFRATGGDAEDSAADSGKRSGDKTTEKEGGGLIPQVGQGRLGRC